MDIDPRRTRYKELMALELEEVYERLFEEVKTWNDMTSNEPLTICPTVCGCEVKNNGSSPMFIGRAINGWCPLVDEGKDALFEYKERLHCCEKCGLSWVEGIDVWRFCIENGCSFVKGKKEEDLVDGRSKRTPFWQTVKYICKNDEDINIPEEEYLKRIIWSNLYKASYVVGGNPTDFYKQQILFCNVILIKEIERYNPGKLYFITEVNRRDNKQNRSWFCRDYSDDLCFRELYEFLADSEWKDKVIVLTRPEFQSLQRIWQCREGLEGNKLEP